VFITEMDIVDFEAIRDLPGLRVIGSCRVNPVNVDIESATAFGVPVFNTPGRNSDGVADLTLAFMIMLGRKMPASAMFLAEPGGAAGDLARMGAAYAEFQGAELWRKTVGIIGLGSVGGEVARRVRSCGAHVLFYDPMVEADEGELHNAEKVTLEELLSRSDFVTVHAPANEGTRAMVGAAQFALMKEGAFFINTARASLVDQAALTDALQSGGLAGAALDVFEVEPPASDDPLVRMSNVITTPHLGGNTFETAAHQGAIVVEQLKALLAGQTPSHLLNPAVMEAFSWEGERTQPSGQEQERLAAKEKPTITS
jgi:autoinducer 2 (AI-2) kinase